MRNGVILLLCTFLFACQPSPAKSLLIGVASSAYYPMIEIEEAYEQEFAEEITLIFGSSGKLAAQIEQGSPMDIFISADMSYPTYLFEKGFCQKPPQTYAVGRLAIFARPQKYSEVTVDSIFRMSNKHIAIPNPEVAPYGKLAMTYLSQNGNVQTIENKLVFGDNVSQTTQFVLSGNADIGVTALSTLLSPNILGKLIYQVVDKPNSVSLKHAYVLMNKSAQKKKDKQVKFSAFLQSKMAKEILHKYGFS